MRTTAQLEQLVALAEAMAGVDGSAQVAEAALPLLREIAGVESVRIVSPEDPEATRAFAVQLPGHVGVVLLGDDHDDVVATGPLELALGLVDAAVGRAVAREELADLSA